MQNIIFECTVQNCNMLKEFFFFFENILPFKDNFKVNLSCKTILLYVFFLIQIEWYTEVL